MQKITDRVNLYFVTNCSVISLLTENTREGHRCLITDHSDASSASAIEVIVAAAAPEVAA